MQENNNFKISCNNILEGCEWNNGEQRSSAHKPSYKDFCLSSIFKSLHNMAEISGVISVNVIMSSCVYVSHLFYLNYIETHLKFNYIMLSDPKPCSQVTRNFQEDLFNFMDTIRNVHIIYVWLFSVS